MTRLEWLQKEFPGFKVELVKWKQFDGPINQGGKEVPCEGFHIERTDLRKAAIFGTSPHETDEERAKWLKE